MSVVAPGVVHADDLGTAWLETVNMVAAAPDRKMSHTTTTITNLREDPDIRERVNALLTARQDQSVETVANTLFPVRLAATSRDVEHLAQRYQAMYARVRQFAGNTRGTYFGRIVDHPDMQGGDQLSLLVRKLRAETSTRGPKSARYEVAVTAPEEDLPERDLSVVVRSPADANPMSFPCLSLCSFQLDHGRLHLLATYRYQYLVLKGYGNYLGLARLLTYVADWAELQPGQLTVVAGRAHADASRRQIEAHLGSPASVPLIATPIPAPTTPAWKAASADS